jgi:hypothetical protein
MIRGLISDRKRSVEMRAPDAPNCHADRIRESDAQKRRLSQHSKPICESRMRAMSLKRHGRWHLTARISRVATAGRY